MKLTAAAAVTLVLLVIPASAPAAVLSYDGTRYSYTAAQGEVNDLRITYYPNDNQMLFNDRVQITGDGTEPASCTYVMGDTSDVMCPLAANPKIDVGDGDDSVEGGHDPGGPEEIHGGPGNDLLRGDGGDDLLDGGPGNDDLDKGGPGNRAGSDVLIGGDGNDTAWYTGDYGVGTEPVTVTLDGVANDGPAGQSDNVQTENVNGSEQADVLVGDGGPNHLDGEGGDDELHGGGGNDFVDGNLGADRVYGEGGDDKVYGGDSSDDLVDGGPGRDEIVADGICFYIGCNSGGNDQIQARDGEEDTVDCGGGFDTAVADVIDHLNVNGGICERVDAAGAAPAGGGGGAPAATFTLRAPTRISLRRLVRRGLSIVVRCQAPCSIRAALLRARVVVGRGSGARRSAGSVTVRVKLTRKAARRLRRAGRLRLTLRVSVTQRGRTTTKSTRLVVAP